MENIQAVSLKIWDAMHNQDIQTLQEYVHENASFVHMGVTMNRQQELEVIEKSGIVYKHIEFQDTSLTDYGVIQILLNKIKLTALVKGHEVMNPFVVSEVYMQDEKNIHLVHMAYTRINY